MFKKASAFNKDIRSWDFTKVWNYVGNIGEYMHEMFDGATSYTYGDFTTIFKNQHVSKFLNTEDDSEIQNKTDEEKGCMYISMENSLFYYEDGEKIFYAKELFIEYGGSWSGADGEYEIKQEILDELKCEDLIFSDVQKEDGEYELQRITDLPEIFDREGIGDGGTKGPFYSEKELINYLKNLKEVSYNKINPNNEDEIDLTYLI